MQGGELFGVLAREGRLPVPWAQFYAACVLSAIDALHSHGFIYRDLKPENVLIDSDGYCKLVDFGFAKEVHSNRTFTVCGTPEYMAPEILLGKGHNKGADFWAIGVLLYEMVTGRTPFAREDDDQLKLYHSIVNSKVTFPMEVMSEDGMAVTRQIVRALLNRSEVHRLGCGKRGAADVKEHSFFDGIEWDVLLVRRPPLRAARNGRTAVLTRL